ncbi:Spy/CpxP family protein refolding chaperone [Pseudomonas guariconensis]|uniref:Spy/CpxP family protein refolding chaperone n=1 Tax=Pseudomonas TaxID=286 RepID=UPI001CE3E0FD|nr:MULTISPECIES: Spy/CpxP family protein refolding chaperone [Pseudomonas]MCO7643195.1 Spy/CpxP family protein refolding chaperone [Pseudomonas sp. S 311-6]MCO7517221.1 Spy/CpxP family protein refolding chaperone [Pseudomonas putida]MCO7567905.1 Spy/CpxP family protein refolding chaperone [Pseudomonas mosselii]MCO7595955.1 Spy/CpxP family protein refolding chaperone [Pseudomonas guariconensis]MCO7607512.1 Spy/CpxP family protein refolding chaperone [Pseudomonas guariconensis]
MRKTLIALMFAAALPTVAMAMPDGGPRHNGPHHRGDAPFAQLDLSREQRQQIGKLMGEQMKQRRDITQRYLDKLPAAEQKALKDELKASHDKTQADIRGLLKPEQQKKFDELQKKRAERKAEWKEFQAWKAEKAGKAQ